jgi:hypothetical protein
MYHPACTVKVEGIETRALRDTGATVSVVDVQLVPENKYTGETKLVTLASNECRRVPIAKVYMETPFFEGEADVLVMERPVQPVLVGNNRFLSSKQINKIPVYPTRESNDRSPDQSCHEKKDNQRVVDEKKENQGADDAKEDDKKTDDAKKDGQKADDGKKHDKRVDDAKEDRADYAKEDDQRAEEQEMCAQVETRSTEKQKVNKELKVGRCNIATVTTVQLKEAQLEDETLRKCREEADMNKESNSGANRKTRYIWNNGLLRREFRERDDVKSQIVVPKKFREDVMA